MNENENINPRDEEESLSGDEKKITVKRKMISVPTEEDVSAISMLTPEDFILKADKKRGSDTECPQKENGEQNFECSLPDGGSDAFTDGFNGKDDEELEFTSTNLFFDDDYEIEAAIAEEADEAPAEAEEEAEPLNEESDEDEKFYLLSGDEGEEPTVTLTKRSRRASYNPNRPRKIDTVFDFLEIFVFSLVAVLIFTTFFFRHTIVDGPSMEQTLFDGEHLIITNLFYTPQRGDVIVCEDFETGLHKPIVKRVIAIEGDKVEVLPTCIKVNGEIIPEPYVYTGDYVGAYRNDEAVCRTWYIGEGEVFILGDHRNNSEDSRKFGPVRCDSILGKVLLRFYPFDRFGTV